MIVALWACALGSTAALAQHTELVSIHTNGQQGNDISGRFAGPAMSANGQVVAFDSQASTLVPGDTNLRVDVFVRDRATDTTERVSVSTAGLQGNNTSTRPAIDGSGDLVAFDSSASNLVEGDTNQLLDVFVHNRITNVTERISVSSDEEQGNAGSNTPTMSANGRYVCFVSLASNLVPDDLNNVEDIFVRDLLAGTTERVNLTHDDQEANSSTTLASISADGRWVAFSSFATNLVPDDSNGHFDVFVHDRQTGLTERISVGSNEEEANAPSSSAAVSSGEGRFVVYHSDATNLVPNDTNDRRDIFVRDRMTGTTERVSISSNEEQANGSSPEAGVRGFVASTPQITPDGRYVAFFSSASNLVPNDTNTCAPNFETPGSCPDVFVRDLVAGTTARVSVARDGTQANDRSADPAMSPSGLRFAFFSAAGNLVTNDANNCPPIFPVSCPDIFVHELASPVSVHPADLPSLSVDRLSMRTHPNPTHTGVDVSVAGADPAQVSMVVYDVAGRLVRILRQGKLATTKVTWNGEDDRGRRVEPGTYFIRIASGGRVVVEKITLLED